MKTKFSGSSESSQSIFILKYILRGITKTLFCTLRTILSRTPLLRGDGTAPLTECEKASYKIRCAGYRNRFSIMLQRSNIQMCDQNHAWQDILLQHQNAMIWTDSQKGISSRASLYRTLPFECSVHARGKDISVPDSDPIIYCRHSIPHNKSPHNGIL